MVNGEPVSEPILVIGPKNDKGYHPVIFRGKEFALGSSPYVEMDYRIPARFQISFSCLELPPAPPAKPKRKYSTAMGLRKPR